MAITRAGGHVLTDKGWVLVDSLEESTEEVPALSMDNTKAELLAAAEGLDVDESMTKAEILEVLEDSHG